MSIGGNNFINGIDYINVKRRLCTQANKDRLAQAISEYDWSSILTVNDAEDAYATFASALQSLYNEHCPLKTVRIKRLDAEKPYVSLATDLKNS